MFRLSSATQHHAHTRAPRAFYTRVSPWSRRNPQSPTLGLHTRLSAACPPAHPAPPGTLPPGQRALPKSPGASETRPLPGTAHTPIPFPARSRRAFKDTTPVGSERGAAAGPPSRRHRPHLPAPRTQPRPAGGVGGVTLPRQMWQVMGSVRDSVTLGPSCAMAGPAGSTEVPRAAPAPAPAPLRQPARPSRAPLGSAARGRAGAPHRSAPLCSPRGGAPGVHGGLSPRTTFLGEARRHGERRHCACAGGGRRGSEGDLLSPDKPMKVSSC